MLRWRSHSLWFTLPFLACACLSLLSSAGLAQSSGAHEAGQGSEPGLIGPVNHRAETLELAPQEGLFLYTDGINEAMNAADEQFDYARMEQVLEATPAGRRPGKDDG